MPFRLLTYWLVILYFYSFFSNPHLRFSLTRKSFSRFGYIGHSLFKKKLVKPKSAPRILLPLAIIRDSYLILLRFHFVEKILRNHHRKSYQQTYESIVKKRFGEDKPYLIAGDHFSSFYPRNLGFFYSKALEPETTLSLDDYKNRLVTFLNSLDFALEFFQKTEMSTTIVPIFRSLFLAGNVYSKPADTLCSLLIAFERLLNPNKNNKGQLNNDYYLVAKQAQEMASSLFFEFKDSLKKHFIAYIEHFSPQTGLIKKEASLSGIRDGCFRQSSFYENVVAWKTIQLALDLNLLKSVELPDNLKPSSLKSRIIESFCKHGIIFDDLDTKPNLAENLCSDFTVSISLGFWDLSNSSELEILESQVNKFYAYSLVKDIGPQYSLKNPKKLAFLVRLFAKDYMGLTIWSHWSTEFVTTLLTLYKYTLKIDYLFKAEKIVSNILDKIDIYKGYPELYDINSKPYKTRVYVSMIDTGWIVNFDWVRQELRRYLVS